LYFVSVYGSWFRDKVVGVSLCVFVRRFTGGSAGVSAGASAGASAV
jgi:hypothetical protein